MASLFLVYAKELLRRLSVEISVDRKMMEIHIWHGRSVEISPAVN
jgi:hypothetical protein